MRARRNSGALLKQDAGRAREEILAAARSTVLRFGLAKTTMDDIASEAGVSRPSIYRYFSDRNELIFALIEWRGLEVIKSAREFVFSLNTFEEKLVDGLLHLVDVGRNDPIVFLIVSPGQDSKESRIDTLPLAVKLTTEFWEPILEDAKKNGEMREDIDTSDACRWLTYVQYMLSSRLEAAESVGELDTVEASHRAQLLTFVLPAFLP
jgi:AcrR family transcriptional regulator